MSIRIGLISDTHSHLDPKVFKHFEAVDEIWHAGDIGNIDLYDQLTAFKPIRAVYGNIDGHDIRQVCPKNLIFKMEQLTIWMTHIGGYPPKYNSTVRKYLQLGPPDLFICGHSHMLKIMRDPAMNNMLYINPGAAGIHGFHSVKTLVRFTLDQGQVKDMQVVELGSRAKKKQGD